ncbi:MAG: SPOR domain-containing protein [Alphaproteobacteria bacterium]
MQNYQHHGRFGKKPFEGEGRFAQSQNPHHPAGFHHAAPDYFDADNAQNRIFKRISGGIMAGLSNSTLLSTVAVLGAGAIFAFALYSFYPSGDKADGAIPIIKAEAVPIRVEPTHAGGMDIPFRESTIFGGTQLGDASGARPIENLLEAADSGAEEVLGKQELIAQSEPVPAPAAVTETDTTEGAAELVAAPPSADELQEVAVAAQNQNESETMAVPSVPVPPVVAELNQGAQTAGGQAAQVSQAADKITHEPATSPETLAFVKSVLEKKDAEKETQSALNTATPPATQTQATQPQAAPQNIEPAAGVEGVIDGARTHFVQLASIPDRGRVDSEWAKLKSEFSGIPSGSQYRVQEANLGERGTFFRIQAGPYTEAQAKSICDSIKAQKPGGCLVVR